jgi:hypothetical protein
VRPKQVADTPPDQRLIIEDEDLYQSRSTRDRPPDRPESSDQGPSGNGIECGSPLRSRRRLSLGFHNTSRTRPRVEAPKGRPEPSACPIPRCVRLLHPTLRGTGDPPGSQNRQNRIRSVLNPRSEAADIPQASATR